MNVLVTDSSGFIGSVLVKALLQRGHHVSAFDRVPTMHALPVNTLLGDIRSCDDVQAAVQGQDMVYHLAGVLGSHELIGNVRHSLDVNVGGTLNVLESCRIHRAKMLLVSKPNVWLNTYSITRETAEQFSKMYMVEYGVITTIVKWFDAYGPGQKVGPGHIQKVVPTFIVNALENRPLSVFGDGKQTADFIYVDDLVEATIAVAETPAAVGRTVEIGTGIETSMLQLCKMILDMTESSSEIEFQPMRPGETANTELRADMATLKETTGFVPRIKLDHGLKQTIAYYRQMLDRVAISSAVPTNLPDDSGCGASKLPTIREMEVLRLLALGYDTKEIAGELYLSPHTVLNHIRNIREKLQVPTRLGAVLAAQRRGLL